MAHRIIGIDIGEKDIKVSKIIPNNNGFDIDETRKINITEEDYFDTLKSLFNEEKNSFFVMGASGLDIYKRDISLPFVDKAKVLKVLPFQIEQKVPLKLEQIYYDYNISKDNANKTTNILTYIVEKEELRKKFQKIRENNLKLRAMLPDTLAYRYLYNTLDDNLVAFLDIGAKHSRFLVFNNEQIISDLTIKMAGNNIDAVIAETFSVNLSMAKEAKEKVSNIFEFEGNQDESKLIIEKIIKEKIDNILSIINIELKRVNLDETISVYLLGGGANINNLPKYVESKLNLSVKRSSMWKNPIYAKSIGYALRETSYIKDCKINLLKGEFSLKSSESGFLPKNIWLYLFYIVVLISLFFTNEKLKYDNLKNKIDKIESNTQRISQKLIKDDFYEPTELLSIISDRESNSEKVIPDHTALDHLSNISKLLLDAKIKLDVKDIDIAEKQISMSTVVDSIDIIDQLVEVLHKDKCYKTIKKGNTKSDKKTNQIRITLTINNLDC
jgi:Tfp pilus assembly PilM family ATPase